MALCDYSAQKRPFVPVCCAYLSKTSNFAPNQTSPSTQKRRSRPTSKQKSTAKLTPQTQEPAFLSLPSPHLIALQAQPIPVHSLKLHPVPQHSSQHKLAAISQWPVAIGQKLEDKLKLDLKSSYGRLQESIVNSFALDAFQRVVKCLVLLTQGKVQNSALESRAVKAKDND